MIAPNPALADGAFSALADLPLTWESSVGSRQDWLSGEILQISF